VVPAPDAEGTPNFTRMLHCRHASRAAAARLATRLQPACRASVIHLQSERHGDMIQAELRTSDRHAAAHAFSRMERHVFRVLRPEKRHARHNVECVMSRQKGQIEMMRLIMSTAELLPPFFAAAPPARPVCRQQIDAAEAFCRFPDRRAAPDRRTVRKR